MRGRGLLFLVAGLYALGILAPAAVLAGILFASLERERVASFDKRQLELRDAGDAVVEAVDTEIAQGRERAPVDPGGELDALLRKLWGPAAPEHGLVRLVFDGPRGAAAIHPFERRVDTDPSPEDALLITSTEYRSAMLAEQRGDHVEAAGRLRLALTRTTDAREAAAIRLALARAWLAQGGQAQAAGVLAEIDLAEESFDARLRLRILDASLAVARTRNPRNMVPDLRRAALALLGNEAHRFGYFAWAAAMDTWAGPGSERRCRLRVLRGLYDSLSADRAALEATRLGTNLVWAPGEGVARVATSSLPAGPDRSLALTFMPVDRVISRARARGLDTYLARRDFELTEDPAGEGAEVRVNVPHRTLGIIDRAPVGATVWADADARLLLILTGLTLLGLFAGFGVTLWAVNKQARLARLRADFISSVSHELKTPLTSLLLFTDLLRSGRVNDPEKVREYHDFMGEESAKLAHLVSNILDFSRLEEGRKTYSFAPVDVGDALRRTAAAFAARAEAAGARIDHTGAPVGELPVKADRDALERVLANLLDNAIKYGAVDNHAIELGAKRIDGRVEITVTDHGPGIPAAARRRVFARFARGDHHGPDAPPGSGLGLAIVAELMAAHDGSVAVTETPGGGTTVMVSLCVADREAIANCKSRIAN